MKATKKPVTIECFKYDGDLMNSEGKFYVPDWAEKAYNDGVIYFKDQGEMYIKTLEGDHHASVGDYVIKGVNGELYPCKPDIFERTYIIRSENEDCYGFGWALTMLKSGDKLTRKGWNGKKQYIVLATAISFKNWEGEIVNCEHKDIGNAAIAFVGTSGVQMGWLASQADMLANDWQIFKE